MPKQKPCARLENWAVVESANIASYQALRAGSLLVGKVFSHPTIGEGTFIFSSPIVRLMRRRKLLKQEIPLIASAKPVANIRSGLRSKREQPLKKFAEALLLPIRERSHRRRRR